MNKNFCILVVSCDNYKDCWNPFFDYFTKNWQECSYQIYLGTNNETFSRQDIDINVIKIGEDLSWTENLKKMLDNIPFDYVLTILDDMFIDSRVDDKRMAELFEYMLNKDISCARFNQKKNEPISTNKIIFKNIDARNDYCVNTQPAIWKKEALLYYLKEKESAWEFEIRNSHDAKISNKLYGDFTTPSNFSIHHLNGIIQRKWVPSVLKIAKKNNICIDTSKREIMTKRDERKLNIKETLATILPKPIKKLLKKLLLKTKKRTEFVDKNVF